MPRMKVTDYDYHGLTMCKPLFPPISLDKLKEATFEDRDVIISTYPKCGTTWMQEIVYQIVTGGDFEGSNKTPVHERFNFLEMHMDTASELDKALAKDPPRLLKTHLSSTFYKKTLEERQTKFIIVFRNHGNPKDMMVSYYNFHKMAAFDFDENGTWEEFFGRFQKDKIVHGNYFDMQLSWWAYKDNPNVLITKFEEMLKDPVQAVREVADHLGKKLSDDLLMKIVERTSFKSMKQNPMLNYSTFNGMDHKISPFMRKGQVGDWKNYFTQEQKEYVDNISKLKFEPEGIFLEDE